MLDVLWLMVVTVRAACRQRNDLVLEHLLRRHHLAVLTRPTRQRMPHTRTSSSTGVLWDGRTMADYAA